MTKWHGGKGSAPRPVSVPKAIWDENWERVFGSKDKDLNYESDNPLERPCEPPIKDNDDGTNS